MVESLLLNSLRTAGAVERLDFREIEQLVKAQILQTAEGETVLEDSPSLTAAGNYSENNNSDLGPAEKNLGNLDLPVNQTKNGQQNSFDSLTQLNSLDNSTYEQLCSVYSEPLEKLND